jgi:hypothetical protein
MSSIPNPIGPAKEHLTPGKVAAGGAAALVLGSFLPWVSATTVFGSISINGMDGDGKLTALLGVISCLVMFQGITKAARSAYLTGTIFAAVAGVVVAYDFANISSEIAGSPNDYAVAQIGTGLYICGAGAVAATIGGFIARSKVSEVSASTPLEPPTSA